MYTWRVILGGVASASLLAMGAATPALANTSPVLSAVTTRTGALNDTLPISGLANGVPGLPIANGILGLGGGKSGITAATAGKAANGTVHDLTKRVPVIRRVEAEPRRLKATPSFKALRGLSAVASHVPGLVPFWASLLAPTRLSALSAPRTVSRSEVRR